MNDAMTTVLVATGILGIKMWITGTIATYVRGRVMESPNGEDGAVMNFFNRIFVVPRRPLEVLADGHERDGTVNRWVRIGSNDAANIPIGLIALFMAASASTLESDVLIALVWVFVGARFAHTVTYAMAMQPWRTFFYSVSSIAWLIAATSLLLV
ncbi:MAG: putative membrane protein YecN with MAPEG domain [Myxococcota bacterium]|jgi:uncharacterized membrane protein YecN with MAPEG domain